MKENRGCGLLKAVISVLLSVAMAVESIPADALAEALEVGAQDGAALEVVPEESADALEVVPEEEDVLAHDA